MAKVEPPITIEKVVSLGEAVEKVNLLQKLPLSGQHPCIEALSLSVQYQANFDTNFADKDAFVSGVAKFKEETAIHAELVGVTDLHYHA